MSKVREMKRKSSGNRVSELWGPFLTIESFKKIIFLRDGPK